MNRGLVMSLCAIAALAAGTAAHAQNVQLSLNLRYTAPNAPAQGGTWYLVAKTDSANGIAAVNAYISNINTAGIAYGTAATNFGGTTVNNGNYTANTAAQINAALNGGAPYVIAGTPVNVVYFQDTSAAGVITGVGTAGFATRQATDPLRNAASWANATVIASGTFGATRPVFAPKGANVTDANTLATAVAPFNNSLDANTTFVVRGDSVNTLNLETVAGAGIYYGDRNRNGTVTFATDIQPALAQIGAGSGKKWEDGDFSGNGTVTFATDIQPALAKIGLAAPPAPIAAVPEPATIGLVVCGLAGLAFRRRK